MDMKLRDLSPKTISRYLGCMKNIAIHFGKSPAELSKEEIRDWIRVGHGHGFMGISSANGYPLRAFLRKNFPNCGSGQDFIFVSCDGFRTIFSGPEIFLNEEGESILLMTELDGKPAKGGITIAPLRDYFVDRDVWGITHIVLVDRK
ncbi:MAG: hypothetical protein ACOWYE_02310 [Desulfatiglandales bacterium]